MNELFALQKKRRALEKAEHERKLVADEKAKIRELEMSPFNKKVRGVLLGISAGAKNMIEEQKRKQKKAKHRKDSLEDILF